MRLAASNIGWSSAEDPIVLGRMAQKGFSGLEIAPTRLFPEEPYRRLDEAKEYSAGIREAFGLSICSMQSIWFGRKEKVFGSTKEAEALLSYSEAAARFAAAAGCRNLVFGNPSNRVKGDGYSWEKAVSFFAELGKVGQREGVIFAVEPNPPIYGTDFLNATLEAAQLIREVASPALRLNLDFGTVIENGESLVALESVIDIVNHVHVSEPNLAPIRPRSGHRDLARLLSDSGYAGYVSIEMKKAEGASAMLDAIDYVAVAFA